MSRFNQIPQVNLPRSSFDLSHSLKTTFNEGKLIPIMCEEVLPGDSFNCDVNSFCRLASPLSVPIMDNLYLDFHFFFVPNRLVWDNWEKLMGERKSPNDSIDYLVPTLAAYGVGVESLLDYFGIPIGTTGSIGYSALPVRAYWLVWNEWFRDENLQDSAPVSLADSSTVWTSTTAINGNMSPWNPAPRGKRHDYFTSALPWPQKGPNVELPLGQTASLAGALNIPQLAITSTFKGAGAKTTNQFSFSQSYNDNDIGGVEYVFRPTNSNISSANNDSGNVNLYVDAKSIPASNTGLNVDLTSATAITINALRQAFMIQSLLELDAQGGTRYTEIILAHFGVVSPDARLQRPEFLGGFSQNIVINTVAQTSSTDSSTPQANLAAYGISAASKHGFTKSFTEHGYIIGLASVRAELTYQQGLPRFWSRRTRYDFYDPMFAHLGEQAVLNKEIYAQGASVVDDNGDVVDDKVFGYQEHWAEYRSRQNRITGKFRSGVSGTLDVFHLAQNFSALPALNSSFIAENAPMDRVVAVTNEPHFLLDVYFKMTAARPMPVYSRPARLARF